MTPTRRCRWRACAWSTAASLFAGPVIAHDARRLRRRRHQGRAARRRQPALPGLGEGRRLAVVGAHRPQQALGDAEAVGPRRRRGGCKRLLADADVFIENFRTGTLERWGLGWDVLHELNPNLVMVRTTGFGQTGPYATRPGFGTLAESMTGYAHMNGFPDGPPTLPPFALGDGVAAMTGAFAVMMALWWRDTHGGTGQVIDLSIYEPLFWILGPQATVYDQLGIVQGRTGNRAPFTAPRNAYLAKDGRVAGRLGERPVDRRAGDAARRPRGARRGAVVRRPHGPARAPGRARRARSPPGSPRATPRRSSRRSRRSTPPSRRSCRSTRSSQDPQFIARETITTVEHPKLGPLQMQNVIPRLVATPGEIRWCGPELGAEQPGGPAGRARATPRSELADAREMRGVIDAPPDDRGRHDEERSRCRSLPRELDGPGPAARRRRLRAPRARRSPGPTARASPSASSLN